MLHLIRHCCISITQHSIHRRCNISYQKHGASAFEIGDWTCEMACVGEGCVVVWVSAVQSCECVELVLVLCCVVLVLVLLRLKVIWSAVLCSGGGGTICIFICNFGVQIRMRWSTKQYLLRWWYRCIIIIITIVTCFTLFFHVLVCFVITTVVFCFVMTCTSQHCSSCNYNRLLPALFLSSSSSFFSLSSPFCSLICFRLWDWSVAFANQRGSLSSE